jgi:hypothetical protein
MRLKAVPTLQLGGIGMRAIVRGSLAFAFLGMMACGGGSDPMDPVDPPEDPVDPPTEGPASITLLSGGEPVDGMYVVFHNPDGTVIDSGETDANGEFNATIPFNAMMSIAFPTTLVNGFGANHTTLYTIMGVQPNDAFEFDMDEDSDATPNYQQFEVVLPGMYSGATQYEVRNGCNTSQNPDPAQHQFLGVWNECVPGGKGVVLAIAKDGEGTWLAHSSMQDITATVIPPTFGGASNTVVTLPAWQTAFTTAELGASNYPPSAQDGWNSLSFHASGVQLEYFGALPNVKQPNGVYDTAVYDQYVWFGDDLSFFQKALAAPLASTTFDVSALMAGRIIGQSIIPANASRPTLSFYSTADAAKMDGSVFCVDYTNYGSPKAFGIPLADVTWNFLLPPGVSNFQMPALPEDLENLAPNEETGYWNSVATQYGSSGLDGYDAFRLGGMFEVTNPYFEHQGRVVGDSIYFMQNRNLLIDPAPSEKPKGPKSFSWKKTGNHRAFGGGGGPHMNCETISL